MTAVEVDSVAALRACVMDAAQRGASLRIVGSRTWLDAGRPVRTGEPISTRELSGIIEYVPGDLTLTARAGTTLREIHDATGAHGQWLALDPPGSEDGTLGATVATASAGPLRTFFGSPRDLVLGVEFVTGSGVVARGGGRVVKNVAGFDLTRLMTGSWGTLGALTEITVRLHARPEADESVAVPVDPTSGVSRVRQLLRRLPFTPYACEVLNAELARRVIGAGEATALFRLGGNAASVQAQRTALAELGEARQIDTRAWREMATVELEGAVVFRLSGLPSEIERLWANATETVSRCPGALIHSTPSRGVVRCIVPAAADSLSALRHAFAQRSKNTRIGERLPPDLWSLCSSPASDRLSAGIKRTFDPSNVLNIGILGESS